VRRADLPTLCRFDPAIPAPVTVRPGNGDVYSAGVRAEMPQAADPAGRLRLL